MGLEIVTLTKQNKAQQTACILFYGILYLWIWQIGNLVVSMLLQIVFFVASQITSLPIVYSTVYSDADQRKHKKHVTGLCEGHSPFNGEFPAQMGSNAGTRPFDDVIMTCFKMFQPDHFNQSTRSAVHITLSFRKYRRFKSIPRTPPCSLNNRSFTNNCHTIMCPISWALVALRYAERI